MSKTADNVIAAHGLAPHPFEGWSVEIAHTTGEERRFLWLITAEMFIPWHKMPAEIRWSLVEGSPCAISVSLDGQSASASVVGKGHLPALTIPPNADQTLTSVGRWSLLEGRLRPDASLTDRTDRPDSWYPHPSAGKPTQNQ